RVGGHGKLRGVESMLFVQCEPLRTPSDTDRGGGFGSSAAVTSMCSGLSPCTRRGPIILTLVVIVWLPNRKRSIGADCGRAASISSRVPKNSAWLGQTLAHMGFSPTDERS